MKKQIRRRKAIALVLCLFMMLSITPLSYADEMVADAPAADVADSSYESVDVTDVDNSVDSIVSEIFENETPAGDVEGIVEDGTEADATVETPADSEEPQYDADGNLIVPGEGAAEGDGEPVEEVTEGDVPGASCTIEDCACPCHEELTDESMAEGMEAMGCTIEDCACPCHPQQEVKECTCGAEEGQPHDPSCPLYVEVSEEILELYEKLMALETQEEIDAFVKGLTEEQLNALCEYMLKLQEPVVFETVNFTEAGPFMPPVTVETNWPQKAKKMLKAFSPMPLLLSDEPAPLADSDRKNVDGLVTSKVVKQNNDGSFTITLEAYTTGKVTTETKDVPVDIVLVLDQSGSMTFDFNGKEVKDKNSKARRQYAMRKAVREFISKVSDKYSDKANHRIAIVTYGSDATIETLPYPNASVENGWVTVNSTGKTTLLNVIGDPDADSTSGKDSGLGRSPSGVTRVDLGMNEAGSLLRNPGEIGSQTKRQQVVIVFTDGVPTTNSTFSPEVANSAIATAKAIKDDGATVYAVGIFDGANNEQLYGSEWAYRNNPNIPCNGNVGDYWGGSWAAAAGAEISPVDIPAGNRFLNYLSSNSSNAETMGATRSLYDPGEHGLLALGFGWKIESNPLCNTTAGYYLTAGDADSLDTIFQTISEQISTSDYPLDKSAVVKDFVTPYFNMPTKGNVTVKTANCIGKTGDEYTFADAEPSTLSATIGTDKSVSVTGFDFNANDVKLDANNNYCGNKLIIEFDVTPKVDFLGGNNVPTNGTNSGVYAPIVGSTETMGVVEEFEVPHVNVPIKDVTVTAENKNIYLLGTLTQDQLMAGVTVKLGNAPAEGTEDTRIPLELSSTAENYGLETWQNAFVNINIIKPTGISTGMTGDTPYTVTATVTPNATASTSVGTANDMTGKTVTDTAKINVFKPEVTYQDTNVWYGDTAPANLDACKTGEAWKHGTTSSTDTGVRMIGNAPTLSYIYELPQAAVDSDNKIATKKDIPVQATVMIDNTKVNDYTNFVHTNCTGKTDEMSGIDAQFLLHNHTCSLTLTKTGNTDGESFLFKVKKDNAVYMSVSLKSGDSVIINELPVGTYSVSEESGWAWRYNPSWTVANAEFTANGKHNATLICTNAKNIDKWLSANAEAVNVKGQSTQNGTVNKTETSTTSHGTMAVENMNYPVPQPAANPEAAVAYVLDAIMDTNGEEGELNA